MAMYNVSSKYKDIISKSTLVSSGSPVLYQLTPKKETFGTLSRKTVGEKNLNKKNKTVLLVGETGSGKSTLINVLVNYAMGVKFRDNIWFKIVEDERRSQSESQTSDVIVYQIFGFEDETLPFSLTVIDTPGYGDTRGNERDVIISQRLLDLFRSEDGVHEIDAVGLVLQAGVNRVTDRLKYIFDSVTSLFGKDIEKNIVALITHSDGIAPTNALKALEAANIKCARNEDNQPVHFLFNNHQNELRTKDNEFALDNAWRLTERGMGQFKDFLDKSTPQKLITTLEVLQARIRLTACINNLQERIQVIEQKQNEIQQTEKALKKHEEKMTENKEFIVEVYEIKKVKVKIDAWWDYKAVTCNICKENCHHPGCTWAWGPKSCEVMKKRKNDKGEYGVYCTSCTGKCPASDHVKENWKYVSTKENVQKTLQGVEQKFEKNQSGSEKKSVLENLQTEMNELESEKTKCLDEICRHVDHLELIALNVNLMSTYVHLDFVIKKMEEKGEERMLQKLKKMASRVDGKTKAVMWQMFVKRDL